MRIILFIVWVTLSPYSDGQYAYSRNQLASQRQERQGNSWDIRLAVPGEPGTDYPTLGGIPKTSFSCAGKKPGYYADIETSCQAFRICTLGATYGYQSFLCPNGTLFNQQVFVCDWWMNVNCQESQKYYIMNNDKYENLRLGAHMMNDIKSMLTHSMRNPYDKANVKSNYMVMQDYKPPSGQMFPNGAQRSGFERALTNVYVPAKQLQSPFNQNNVAAASTPSPQYVPSVFNNGRNNQLETFQRQSKSGHYSQNNQQTFSNGHSGKISETNNAYRNGKPQSNTRNNFQQANYEQNQVTNAHTYNTPNTFSSQVNTQYRDNTLGSAGNTHRQSEFGISFKKEQFTYPTQQSTISTSTQQFINVVGQVNQINEAKSNLVSEQDPTLTSLNKKITFNRRVKESNQPSSASRLTFNAWLISQPRKTARARVRSEQGPYVYNKPTVPTAPQPARLISEPASYVYNPPTNTPTRPQPARIISEPTPYEYNRPINAPTPQPARLISEPTPYLYNKPTNPPAPPPARLISYPTPYVYPKPTAPPQIARLVSEPTSYYYNKPRPTQAAKLISESGYIYNRPTVAAKLISTTTQPPRTYLAPTTHRPTPPPQLYFVPTTIRPTFSGPFYLVPTQDSNNLRQPEITFGRQRLEPNVVLNSNSDLEVSPTAPTPVYLPAPAKSTQLNTPSFRLTKQSRINSNRNNLTFTDILTKEKLDVTVHDIVKDTSNVLGTVESNQLGQLRQEPTHIDYPDDNYLPPGTISPNDHIESIPLQHNEANSAKLGKLIAAPAANLEPPLESFDTYNENNQNPIAKLPFYKQTNSIPANTIERTVSLKISIPEKTAAYLFNTNNGTEYDKLEILNTGSSNYLVLSNHNTYHYSKPNFIPIGKLVIDENSNISNSQALVFSFLADSLNAAKEYKNIVDENLQTQQQYNNEDVSDITNNISQLTSSQYTQNTVNTNSNIRTSENSNIERGNIKYSNGIIQTQAQITQRAQDNPSHSEINSNLQREHSADYTHRQTTSLTDNQNIFSGQLYQSPVVEVTNQIYNEANNNFVPLKNTNVDHTDLQDLHQVNAQSNVGSKQGSAEVEIVKSHTLQLPSAAAKLQVASTVSSEAQNSQEDTAQIIFNNLINGNGITAQVRDKIIGSISHPHDDKKIVTYKKDQSYYVYTKLEDNIQNKITSQTTDERNGKLIQGNNADNTVTLQLVPSISYQVNDEKEKQRILNAFQINEYGSPNIRNDNGNTGYDNQNKVISNVDYTVDHSVSNQSNGQYRNVENLYKGPSSYSAPQSSVGRLEVQQQNTNQNNNFPARLEQFNEDTGYQKVTPSRQFSY